MNKRYELYQTSSGRYSIKNINSGKTCIFNLKLDGLSEFEIQKIKNESEKEFNKNGLKKDDEFIKIFLSIYQNRIGQDDGLILDNLEIQERNSYFALETNDNFYTVIRDDGKIILENYECKNKLFKNFVESYKGNDIFGMINLFEENSVNINVGGTNSLTETLIGNLKKDEIDEKENMGFSKGEEIVIDNFEKEFSVNYLLDLHKELFGNLYSWAGNIRNIEVSFGGKEGVPYYLIRQELEKLFGDINFRIKNKEDIIDVIVDFEYRFICIHPFINTNGRISRLLTYQIILKYGYRGRPNVYDNRNKRERYLNAMKEFDMGNKEELKQIIKEYLTNFTLIGVN